MAWWSFLLIAGGIYLGLVALAYIFQERLLYFPLGSMSNTPADLGLAYEAVQLETDDGLSLAGWFIPAPSSDRVLLFFHGNAGNISHRLESIQTFHHLGLNVFIIDYRGYGQSEGRPTEQGTYRDAEAAWRYLVEQRHIPPEQIIIFGRSLGGGIATWLAHTHPPRALILESTFTSIPDVAAPSLPFLPVRLLSRIHYNSLERIPRLKCPVLIIHSPEDRLIPYHHGQELFQAAPEPKEFLAIKGGHNDGYLTSRQIYEPGLAAFLNRL